MKVKVHPRIDIYIYQSHTPSVTIIHRRRSVLAECHKGYGSDDLCILNTCVPYVPSNIYNGVNARAEIQILRRGEGIVLRAGSDEGEGAVRLEGARCHCK